MAAIEFDHAVIPYARDDCRVVLDLIVQRANEYLDDPTEERFHAMDQLSLIPTRAF